MRTVIILLAVTAFTLVTGCGRRGPPVKPSVAEARQAKAENRPAPEKPVPNNKNEGKRFILDGLLE